MAGSSTGIPPLIRGIAVGLLGLALIVALATWLVVHVLIKIAMLVLLALATAWAARALSRPHPEIFGPPDTEGERR